MTDTSLVFNVLGRERVGGALSRVASLFRTAGQQAERATRQAAQSTERLDREIKDVEKSLAMLNAEFAATGNKELFVKMKRDRSLLTQLQSVRREVGAANDEVDRLGANDRASSMLGRLGQAGSDAGSTLQTGLRSGLELVASNAWTLVGAAGALVAGLSAISPAAFLAGGALGSLPGIMSGVAAAFGALKLGTMGLTEQWKAQTTASGGAGRAAQDMTAKHRAVEQAAKGVERAERSVKDAIAQVARAERDVTAAQKDAAAATLAVADAVAEEQRRRRDLATDLESAHLDVEDAIAAETQAETDLNAARANGELPSKVDELQRAYERSQIAVTQAKNRVDDLSDAQEEASKTSVDGSAAVVAAKDREKEAQQRVTDAHDAEVAAIQRVTDARDAQKDAVQQLADAQKALNTSSAGGGGGGGVVPPAIAASAQKFLNVLKEMRPAFEQLRLGVQEKLFAGLSEKFKTMATAWLPQLTKSLGDMAGTFNGIASTFMTTASQPSFIKNIGAGVESFRGSLEKIGQVAAGPLTTAFGNLAAAAAPFIDALGGEVSQLLKDFSTKINKLAEGGKNSKLNQFFRTAADVLHDVFDVLRDVKDIVGGVISAVFGQPESGLSPWKSFVATMDRIAAWFRDPENQAKIRDWITKVEEWGGKIFGFFQSIAPVVGPAIAFVGFAAQTSGVFIKTMTGYLNGVIGAFKWIGKNAPAVWSSVKTAFGSAKDWVVAKGGALIDWIKGLPKKISAAASGMWNGLKDAFRSAINWIIGKWNNLSLTIGGGDFLGAELPSKTFHTKQIDYLASGGVVPATPGGRLAVLGEGGRDEAVIPLDRAGGMGGPTEMVLSLGPGGDPALRALLKALLPHLRYEVRTAGRGSVQKLLAPKGAAA